MIRNKISLFSLTMAVALFSINASAQQCSGATITSVRAAEEGTVLTAIAPTGTRCGSNNGGFVCITAENTRQYAAALTAQASGNPVTILFDTASSCGIPGVNVPAVTEIRVLQQ